MSDFEQRARDELKQHGFPMEHFEALRAMLWAYAQGRADAEREMREPMACGHPKACEIIDDLGHLDRTYRRLISDGMFNEDQVDSLRQQVPYCSACQRESRLREALQAVLRYAEAERDVGATGVPEFEQTMAQAYAVLAEQKGAGGTHMNKRPTAEFEVVESERNPGMFAVEAILSDSEGEVITVEFLAHDSKQLAEEYAAWKNQKGAGGQSQAVHEQRGNHHPRVRNPPGPCAG